MTSLKIAEKIVLGHGSGGEIWQILLETVIRPSFPDVRTLDGAVLPLPHGNKIVFTTDSYVIKPIFFPGGNIGSLAVHGTINDLAMMAARPVALSCGFILEEGFLLEDLIILCQSMFQSADQVGMKIVTGDTKVVGKGEADGIFINTSGIGYAPLDWDLEPGRVQPGDGIIINGGVGEHGTVILAHRHGIKFEPELLSDSAPLWPAVSLLLTTGIVPRVMRDLTRGGLAGAVWELVQGLSVDFILEERAIPMDPRVKRAGAIWGIDPLYMACEGRFLLIVAAPAIHKTLRILKESGFPDASHIGEVTNGTGNVLLQTELGRRKIHLLAGELLPRIC